MPSLEEKPKSFGNKYFGQLQSVKDENVLLLALDEVKNEFITNSDIQINVPEFNQEDAANLHEESFMARRCIYSLLKLIKSNTNGYKELETDLVKSGLSTNFKNYLSEICRAVQLDQIESQKNEKPMIPNYNSSSWSVDIDLSSSYAKKLLETSVTINLELNEANGNERSTKTIMMTSDKFSDLRFKVAEALKTVQDLKKRKMFAST